MNSINSMGNRAVVSVHSEHCKARRSQMTKYDLYENVTARILAELEKGAVPWVKPWAATAGANTPCNAVTNRPYSGTNTILLWIALEHGWPTPRFLTIKQANAHGGTVRKGEHGTKILFMKPLLVKDKSPDAAVDDVKKISMLREYTVFNVSQCDGLPEKIVNGAPMRTRNPDTRDELADAYITSTGARIVEGSGEAFYAPSKDLIMMPAFEAFKNADNFYATNFHEMTHWTGHKDRLERFKAMAARFGTEAYAAEELVAELGSAFQCAEFAFDGDVRDAGYIQHWIRLLKEDKKAFFTATSAAQKAVDFLRGKALEEDEDAATLQAA
jgi:antirestriction protein ArdC